jgi:uncharacterized protein DUF4339
VTDRWFYTHGKAVHGPVSGSDLRRLAYAGGLLPTDRVWPAGRHPHEGVPAEAAIPFPDAPTSDPLAGIVPPPLPDWLPDLAAAVASGADLADLPSPPPEAWLPDVGRAEGSDSAADE